MNCDCSSDWGEPCEYIAVNKRVAARKQHVCCECGEPIVRGQQYELLRGVWDDGWNTFRTCVPCATIGADYCRGNYVLTTLRETLWECLGTDYVTGETRDA